MNNTDSVLVNDEKMLTRVFFNMLPVQILIVAMGSINSIVDGTIAGRYIGMTAVGVIGLYYVMVEIMQAVGAVLLGGTTVLCGKYMGKGDLEKTSGIFSLNLSVAFFIGAFLTIVSLIVPGALADALGVTSELRSDLVTYIVGYAFGIIPMLVGQQVASFLQMERQSTRGYVGIAGMTISNFLLDILLVSVFRMGMLGLGLATSVSNLVYCIILVPYYFSSKAQFKFGIKLINWNELIQLLKIGTPGALLVFCIAIRDWVLNIIIIKYCGNDALSAKSALGMVSGIFIAYSLGNGAVVRMLISVFAGEENKNAMRKTLKIVFTKGMLLSVIVSAFICLISPLLTSVFFPDSSSNVYHLAYILFMIYALCIPLILICQIFTNYLQAMRHTAFVNFLSVFDGFFSMVIPSVILAPIMGAMGVWIANPIGIVLTILTVPVYCILYWKRLPGNIDECMFLKPDFGISEKNILDLSIHDMDEVALSSAKAQDFCLNHGMEKKSSYYVGLCLEEMAGNVIQHGFTGDKKKHSLNSMVIFKDNRILLRIKDDCVPFNPVEMSGMMADKESLDNIGIRMVVQIADDVSYQNLLGLNVLTITIADKDQMSNEEDDFLLELTLRREDADLHQRFKDIVFVTKTILTKYKQMFPEYTDHSALHSMTIIDSCNRLIGKEQIKKLNADEIYILLVSCYLHDVGMGINEKDFEELKIRLGASEFFEKNPNARPSDFVRINHHEFSGFFVEKYSDLLDIPSPEHVFAIKQVVRGHRKTDLYDEKEYPSALKLPDGNTVCLPYLAALIRLSDEIDVVATRNPLILFDIDTIKEEISIIENKKLQAVKTMHMTGSSFVFTYKTDEPEVRQSIYDMAEKMQSTLDYCRDVVEKRTNFKVTQEKVILRELESQ
ncbi:MAG: ATP-binding protein [Lachnospiraceae bacterium]|nr:ATP-binding protein [Lachnospiraceae bacterium]